MIRQLIDGALARQRSPPLCKDCRFFAPPKPNKNLCLGRCTRYGKINLVDGSVQHPYAEVAREFDCNGWWHEPREDACEPKGK